MRLTFVLGFVALTMLSPGAARANGRFPTAQQLVLGVGAQRDRLTFRVTFGLLVSDDGARSFRWLCEEAMFTPEAPGAPIDPAVEIDDRGRTLFGYGGGLRWWSPDHCGVTAIPELRAREVIDLTATPDRATLYGLETTAGSRQWVLRAAAADLAFVRQGEGIPGVRLSTLDVAPGDPERLFLGGLDDTTRAPLVLRSDDGGRTVTRLALPARRLGDDVFVAGVDPRDRDRVWLRTNVGLGSVLLRAHGEDLEELGRTSDPMLGFARSDDGRTVWYGSVADGLYRSDDGGARFTRVNPLAVYCLAQREGVLWACGDWLRGPFALGRSTDGGARFTPVLRFEDLAGPVACAGEAEARCEPRWPGLQRDVIGLGPRDAGAIARDATVVRDAPMPGDARAVEGLPTGPRSAPGCACDVDRSGTERSRSRASPWALLLVAVASQLQKRRV